MKDYRLSIPLDEAEAAPPRYLSFVLRCQAGAGGEVRARLFDVRSGVSCPVNDLDELPDVVRRLMTEASPVAEGEQ